MGRNLSIFTQLHTKTARKYLQRMQDEKVHCMQVARKYDKDFWDGERRYGYGGYKYDGRWEKIAKQIIEIYELKDGAKILDIGCGKAFLLYELKKLLPNAKICGFDISQYAINNAPSEIKSSLFTYSAANALPFGDLEFDLAFSLGALHNLRIFELKTALFEINRIAKEKFIMVESYRNENELFNLQCWALTAESFFSPAEWIWLYREFGYAGDYEFIYFE